MKRFYLIPLLLFNLSCDLFHEEEECQGDENTIAVSFRGKCQEYSDFTFSLGYFFTSPLYIDDYSHFYVSSEKDSNFIVIVGMIDSVQTNTEYGIYHTTDFSLYTFVYGLSVDNEFAFDPGVSIEDINGGIIFTEIDTSSKISGYLLDGSTIPGFHYEPNDTSINLNRDIYKSYISGGFAALPQ